MGAAGRCREVLLRRLRLGPVQPQRRGFRNASASASARSTTIPACARVRISSSPTPRHGCRFPTTACRATPSARSRTEPHPRAPEPLGLRLVLLGADPLAADRQVLDAHRCGHVQPHAVTEELVDPLGLGGRRQGLHVCRRAARSTRARDRGSPRRHKRRTPGVGASGSRGCWRAARRTRCPSPP